jgi:hypothetical protein
VSLTLEVLSTQMIAAARQAVGSRWTEIQELAEVELRRLAASLLDIHGLLRAEKINHERARQLVHIHKTTVQSVLSSVKGIGVLTAKQVPLMATRAVGNLVNQLVGFRLIATKDGSTASTPDFRAGKDI